MFDFLPDGHYLLMFAYSNTVCASVQSGRVAYVCIRLFRLSKILLILVYSRYYYTYCVRQRAWCLEWLCNFIPVLIWKSRIRSVKFLLVFDRYSTFEIFYVVCILIRYNHISIDINLLVTVHGWRFPDISNISIILCGTLVHQYTYT